ncbi:MAG: CBS domain-containing protein [Flavitalea sp.]
MRIVKDIIESKPMAFNSIDPKALVIEALQLLNSVNLSYLTVLDGDKYKGVFSERDYTRNLVLKGRSSSGTTVEEVMTTDLPQVKMDDTVEHCMNLMEISKTRYLLAFDGYNFVGVITIHDLLRQVIANKEEVFDHQLTRKLIDNEESPRIY